MLGLKFVYNFVENDANGYNDDDDGDGDNNKKSSGKLKSKNKRGN